MEFPTRQASQTAIYDKHIFVGIYAQHRNFGQIGDCKIYFHVETNSFIQDTVCIFLHLRGETGVSSQHFATRMGKSNHSFRKSLGISEIKNVKTQTLTC